MPQAAKAVFDRCVKISNLPPDDPEYSIECDFRLLDSSKDDFEILRNKKSHPFFAPTMMIENERESLLSHPLVKGFLSLKWRRIARPITSFTLILYVSYVLIFTTFLVRRRNQINIFGPDDNRTAEEDAKSFHKTKYDLTLPMLVTILIVMQCIKEIAQMVFQGLKYFKNIINVLEWSSYILALLFMIPHIGRINHFLGTGALWPLGASAVLLMYTCLILFLRSVSGALGIYISMFIEILKTMGKVVVMFSLFIFSFGLVFFTLLKEQVNSPPFAYTAWQTLSCAHPHVFGRKN